MILTIILFILTYILMLIFTKYKTYIAFAMSIIFLILGIININEALSSIDYNVIMMMFGIMGTVSIFIDSNMPNLIAAKLINKASNTKILTVLLCLFSAVVSAFVDNVATVFMIAPIAIASAKELKVNPIPIVIAVSIFSNLEGAATLVGDTTSILLASAANMNFMDFFFYNNKIGLFFIVQISVLLALLVLYYILKENKKTKINKEIKVNDYAPSIILILTILSLIIASFIPNKISIINGIICISYYVILLIYEIIKNKKISIIIDSIKSIDYETLLLLASLFILIYGVKKSGGIDLIANMFLSFGNNEFILYTLIILISVIISAFIDNIPYVATMLPVISYISLNSNINPIILYYGLIVGATLGGNYTPIGASANIASIGILRKNNYEVSLKEYLKISIPITTTALLAGYILIILLM